MSIVYVLIGIFLLYAFQGIFSIIPYFFGMVFKFLLYPIEIINQVIYPVGAYVYAVYAGIFIFFIFRTIIRFLPIFKN